jgi:hypothetical protein
MLATQTYLQLSHVGTAIDDIVHRMSELNSEAESGRDIHEAPVNLPSFSVVTSDESHGHKQNDPSVSTVGTDVSEDTRVSTRTGSSILAVSTVTTLCSSCCSDTESDPEPSPKCFSSRKKSAEGDTTAWRIPLKPLTSKVQRRRSESPTCGIRSGEFRRMNTAFLRT